MLHGVKPVFTRFKSMSVTKIVALFVALLFLVLKHHKASIHKGFRDLLRQNVALVALFLKSI